ncbi:MAG TPA: restriction endonuclease subunit S [Caulobacteraceae bacterium]|jgi:restriction endonuclease S subunit|nr:restriction endonuclease subunit S [Caulobacteraceae bacterium]
MKLKTALREVKKGVGPEWANYRLLGVTRSGIGAPKEPIGKTPSRYKLVDAGTIVYNPMRVLLGSIGILRPQDEPGIISPDYVVFKTDETVLDPYYFFAWMKSSAGIDFISQETRGAVRQRLKMTTLGQMEVSIPDIDEQRRSGHYVQETLSIITSIQAAFDRQKADLELHRDKLFDSIPALI